MNAIPNPTQNLRHTVARGRWSAAGGLTSGGRLTLLILVTGLIVLAQAWQVAHRYGQHATNRRPVPAQRTELQISTHDVSKQ